MTVAQGATLKVASVESIGNLSGAGAVEIASLARLNITGATGFEGTVSGEGIVGIADGATLDFGDGSLRTATLGLVQSFGANGEASTRVKLPEGSPTWGRVGQRAVIPIPHGITSFTVDGVATETGLDGDAGWFAMSLHGGQTAALALQDAEMDSFNALLSRLCDATHVVFR